MKEKIRGSDQEYRKRFLKTITGKTSFLPGTEISVKETWREGVIFEIHTCFNSIDVPGKRMEKEKFLAALDGCLIGEGYNIA